MMAIVWRLFMDNIYVGFLFIILYLYIFQFKHLFFSSVCSFSCALVNPSCGAQVMLLIHEEAAYKESYFISFWSSSILFFLYIKLSAYHYYFVERKKYQKREVAAIIFSLSFTCQHVHVVPARIDQPTSHTQRDILWNRSARRQSFVKANAIIKEYIFFVLCVCGTRSIFAIK